MADSLPVAAAEVPGHEKARDELWRCQEVSSWRWAQLWVCWRGMCALYPKPPPCTYTALFSSAKGRAGSQLPLAMPAACLLKEGSALSCATLGQT